VALRSVAMMALGRVIVDPAAAPDGPPTDVAGYLYAGDKFGVQWANGDPDAGLQVGYSATRTVQPTSITAVLPAGTTSYETGEIFSEGTYDAYGSWWVRHSTPGGSSAWVEWTFTP
jgi:hypothetical protein